MPPLLALPLVPRPPPADTIYDGVNRPGCIAANATTEPYLLSRQCVAGKCTLTYFNGAKTCRPTVPSEWKPHLRPP